MRPIIVSILFLAACDGTSSPPDAAPVDAIPYPDVRTNVATCAEASTPECFSSFECAADRRCQDIGVAGTPVPCCVPGARGTTAAGEPCTAATGELTCASSICLEGTTTSLCSTICGGDAGPCPANMPSCIPIAFSGSDDNWCFPE